MIKVWVTGANGMLGSSLMQTLSQKGIEAMGTTHADGDVCNLEALRAKAKEFNPTHIVNCAAFTDVDGAEDKQEAAFAINADGAANVAMVAMECQARLVHISTDFVFNGMGQRPYREEELCSPVNAYGASKWEGEKKVLEIFPNACILRTSWIFGGKGKNFISSLLTWFQQKEELRVVSDQIGRPTYAQDLADAVIALLDQEGIVHFANEGELSRYQIALDLLEMAKMQGMALKCQRILPVPSAEFPTRAVRPAYSVLDTQKYSAVTKLQPRSWNEAAMEFVGGAVKV